MSNDAATTDGKAVEKKVDWKQVKVGVQYKGKEIILPEEPGKMSYSAARDVLARIEKEENTVYQISEKVQGHFWDGVVAISRAIEAIYGVALTSGKTVQTFFGPMKVPASMLNVRVGPGATDFVEAPYGDFQLPNVSSEIRIGSDQIKGMPCATIEGNVLSKERHVVMELVLKANQIIKEQSIYRGKSIILDKDEASSGIDFDAPLEFFNPVGPEMPIFNADTQRLIDISVLTPIENSAVCRKAKIPLKRGILLEGPYGTGKSLTARYIAERANAAGWTFILVSNAKALKYGLTFAKQYAPAVLFAEDIDRLTGDRNEGANDLINLIDGVVGKNDEIITILTTNFASKIDKSMLRPGRLDTVISLRHPDAETAIRMVQFYAGSKLDANSDLTGAGEALHGKTPSVIREATERAKLAAIFDGRTHITGDDVRLMAISMANHLALFEGANEGEKKTEPLEAAFRSAMKAALPEGFDTETFKKMKASLRIA